MPPRGASFSLCHSRAGGNPEIWLEYTILDSGSPPALGGQVGFRAGKGTPEGQSPSVALVLKKQSQLFHVRFFYFTLRHLFFNIF